MKKFQPKSKTITFSVVFLLFIIVILSASYYNWRHNYYNKVEAGVKIGEINLSYLSAADAEEKIIKKIDQLELEGIPATYNNETAYVPSVLSVSADLSFPVFFYNRAEIIEDLLENKISTNFFAYLSNKIAKPFNNNRLEISYFLDKEKTKTFIVENLKNIETAPVNAAFKIEKDLLGDLIFEIESERIGRQVDFDSAFSNIDNYLLNFLDDEILIKTVTARPSVYRADLESLKSEAQELLLLGDLKVKLSEDKKSWTVKEEVIASWLVGQKIEDEHRLDFDIEKIAAYLEEKIATEINKEAKTPKYEMENGKISSWQLGNDGLKLNSLDTAYTIRDKYLLERENELELIVEITKSDLNDNPDSLSIKEIIGTGQSNFAGSPSNRRHNIAIGAEALNGVLIAPGGEFSLVEALGDIDASTGYLPELVIKNNRTIPEYGGGLCQVATTLFRSALSSGLNITARQNHSYRVSYYEPAGTDAAIYDPWPDVKFLNDTANYILIQSRIEKDDIYFDFWGQNDGRIATTTTPVIYNIVKPAPTKIIESPDLKPGERKCTERAHNGADAYFDYVITYNNGESVERRFKSHYVPWQEVCLVGVETPASSTPVTDTTNATSSEAVN